MNSSLLVVETPKKRTISSKKDTAVECRNGLKRVSPSRDIIKILKGLERLHRFQYHWEVSLVDMKKMSCLSKKLTEDLGFYFQSETPDIPEVIFKLEEIATDEGYYNLFLKEFLSEEFSTDAEFSFSILTVLNYMTVFSVSLAEALHELFQLPSNESVCELCIETEAEDKEKASNSFNFILIQNSIDKGGIDDSYDDCDYKQTSLDQHVTDDSYEDIDEDEYTFKDSGMVGMESGVDNSKQHQVKRKGEDHDKPFLFNPFDTRPPTTVKLPDPVSSEKLNSTMFFNPFSAKKRSIKFDLSSQSYGK